MTPNPRSVEEVANSLDDGSARLHRIAVREITTDRAHIATVLIAGLEEEKRTPANLMIPNESPIDHALREGFNLGLDTAIALIRTTLDVTSEEK